MNGEPQTAEQINRPLTGQAYSQVEPDSKPAFDTSRVPMPVAPKNPIRFSIRGVVDKVDDLKAFIGQQDFDADLKNYIQSELDELSSNAAEIHMHDIEHPEGGFDLHLSIRPRYLGGDAKKVFKRDSQ